MKTIRFIIFALLCAVAQGTWAQTSGYPVVMQHVSKEKIDMYIADLTEEQGALFLGIPSLSIKSGRGATVTVIS